MGASEALAHPVFPLILAAPSGAGKTSIARELGNRRSDLEFSISCTTRPPRAGERDGVDYHFRSRETFEAMVSRGELLEWAEVHNQLYGTPRANLEIARERRHFLLLDIDVQGSRQIKGAVPEAVSVFVLPPSGKELAARLVGRGSEAPDTRRRRLLAAREELQLAVGFDYVIINDDLTAAVNAVETIIQAESARSHRLSGLPVFLARLIDDVDAT